MTIDELYILGAGSIGCLIAHAYASLENAPIVYLILRNDDQIEEFKSFNSEIRLGKRFIDGCPTSSVEVRCCKPETIPASTINNLIVATKVYQTADALRPLTQYLNKNSNIIIVQNGMGVYDLIKSANIWPSEYEPRFYQGVTSHGAVISSENRFHIYQNGSGYLVFAPISNTQTIPPILEVLKNSPVKGSSEYNVLNSTVLPEDEFRIRQFEKLVINSCLNPLCAINNCVNGELLELDDITLIFFYVIKEALDAFLIESKGLISEEILETRLSPQSLYNTVMRICDVNALDSPSMRDDVLALRDTEVDFINGYIVKIANKHSKTADVNSTLISLVKLKLKKARKDIKKLQ